MDDRATMHPQNLHTSPSGAVAAFIPYHRNGDEGNGDEIPTKDRRRFTPSRWRSLMVALKSGQFGVWWAGDVPEAEATPTGRRKATKQIVSLARRYGMRVSYEWIREGTVRVMKTGGI
jgi:ABC-type amino acid transport substrate-binding protein